MPPQTPLLFVDNVFDAIGLYPNATVTADEESPGREAFRVADYRRDRTWWQAITTAVDHVVASDLGVGASRAVDYVFVDRGHNLWGKAVQVAVDDAVGGASTTVNLTVPAVGTVGGDPTSAVMCVTEEGALYSLFAALPARRRIRFYVTSSWQPIVPGLMVGARQQLLGYSTTFDEDAGERTQSTETSRAGYRSSQMTYSWRVCELGLSLIGATEYDSTMRALRRTLFEKNQPWVLFMDYGTKPERGWMYQYDGVAWGMAKNRVHRGGRIRGRELGPVLP